MFDQGMGSAGTPTPGVFAKSAESLEKKRVANIVSVR